MRISRALYDEMQKAGKPAEMSVNGILRGGFVVDDLFYFCGAINSVGLCEVDTNDTVKLLDSIEENRQF